MTKQLLPPKANVHLAEPSKARRAAKANRPGARRKHPQTRPGLRVDVSTTLKRLPLPAGRIRELVAFVAAAERRNIGHVEVAVVGAARMATLNERHLRHAGPTDVLSFDLGPGPGGGLCAQIVVCADVAARQARRRRHPAWKELLLYVTHGLLHAMGHDDKTASAASRMHAREDELLEQFGVGRIYGV